MRYAIGIAMAPHVINGDKSMYEHQLAAAARQYGGKQAIATISKSSSSPMSWRAAHKPIAHMANRLLAWQKCQQCHEASVLFGNIFNQAGRNGSMHYSFKYLCQRVLACLLMSSWLSAHKARWHCTIYYLNIPGRRR